MEKDLLLIKIGSSIFRNTNDSLELVKCLFQGPGISPGIRNWLRKFCDLRAIGFNSICLTSYQHREIVNKAHQCFLGDGEDESILIIEEMNLDSPQNRIKKVSSIPMFFEKDDGAPTTIKATI